MMRHREMRLGISVIVTKLPEYLNLGKAREFFTEIMPALRSDRPCLVFDFSGVCHFDSTGVGVLLDCLEEALKRNGDIKLAALPPGPAVILEMMRVDRLFEIYDDVSDAVESFYEFQVRALEKHAQRINSRVGIREAA